MAQVAQGNVLIADLLRLAGNVPAALRDPASRFAPVLPDFRYLKVPRLAVAIPYWAGTDVA